MRMLQIIDSLEVGGAERLAVNFANALGNKIDFSGIVSTRKPGSLQSEIQKNIPYWCLHKRWTFDLKALFKLRRVCVENQIDWVHAHGTSYFQAFLLKLVLPKINVIWHEHAGARANEKASKHKTLAFVVRFFKGIVVVNQPLEVWCRRELNFNKVLYLPNFMGSSNQSKSITQLKGQTGKRILCLANLRHPKNHLLLVEAARKLKQKHPSWTYHLVGTDAQDDYASNLKKSIQQNQLSDTIFIYGLCEDIHHIIEQADLAVICSISEGLPMALLEFGWHKKPVVSTAVGEIPQIVRHGISGLTSDVSDNELFIDNLDVLMSDAFLRQKFGEELFKIVEENHSENSVIAKYLHWVEQL
ncbi:glycosyltransferase family 4 protein [Flavobacterium sp. CYK-55]|uniref:glycosyltransferase family 4 protein n=1 Tax=Flavobacterium sp. CYK-55 TaxID=2835529 RepID=UPI001BCD3763|nr:glycosyltransferase family 4 protein [Flavobacterium sp. CYK-55]MBS7786395.1 glycosyltransferase family 4 protein [Flavobacterium sp. CYK-55]